MTTQVKAISSAAEYVRAPLIYKGKVRELYDLGEHFLIVVTDRISAFDYVLDPAVPDKGNVLNSLSAYWFALTEHIIANHVVHTDVYKLDRKSTRLNSSHVKISYAVFCLKKKNIQR